MNKKAIALSFLTVLVLALLIWIPTCIVLSGYFKQTSQAVDSFHFLSNQINQFQTATKGEIKVVDQSITMDKGTVIAVFTESVAALIVPDIDEYTIIIPKPKVSECASKKCICLLADLKTTYVSNQVSLSYEKANCNTIPLTLIRTGKSTPLIINYEDLNGKKTIRDRAVYLERSSGTGFGMCEESPCLT